MNFKKIISAALCSTMILSSTSMLASAERLIQLYSENGDTVIVDESEAYSYTRVGWHYNLSDVQTTLYSESGKTVTVFNSEVQDYLAVGWHLDPKEVQTTLYSIDGSTITVYNAQVQDYLAVGWHRSLDGVLTTLYNSDGGTIRVYNNDVQAYLNTGWSLTPQTTLYSQSGETINVPSDAVDSYLSVGWHRNLSEVQTTLYASDGSTIKVYNAQVADYLAVGWSTTPVKINAVSALPLMLNDNYGNSITISYFDIFKCIYIPESDSIEIQYGMLFDDNYNYENDIYPEYLMNCYDQYGNFLKSVDFYLYDYWIIVPSATASFTITVKNSYSSTKFSYCKQVDLYSADGRTITVFDIQAPIYTAVGWYEPVTLYSDDGRKIQVSPFEADTYRAVGWKNPTTMFDWYSEQELQVPPFMIGTFESYGWEGPVTMYASDGRQISVMPYEIETYVDLGWATMTTLYSLDGKTISVPPYEVSKYTSVGWYTYVDYRYQQVKKTYDAHMAAKDYNSALAEITNNEYTFYGTKHEATISKLKSQAMDAWRNAIKTPLAVASYNLFTNNNGYSSIGITFRNVSYKNVIAFKLRMDCYDVFSDTNYTSTTNFICTDTNIAPGSSRYVTWDLKAKDIRFVRNIRIVEVVYEDGTEW